MKISPKFSLCFAISSIMIVLLVSNCSYSQTNKLKQFVIKPGANLCSSEELTKLKELIIRDNYQNLRDGCFTESDIRVDLDRSEVRLAGLSALFDLSIQENFWLRNLFQNWNQNWGAIEPFDSDDDFTLNKTKIGDPVLAIPKAIGKAGRPFVDWTPVSWDRDVLTLSYYANPYFQAFGGDPLGIPIDYNSGTGLTFQFGTPYSSVMESDFVSGGLHIFFLNISATSRIKEFVSKHSSNSNIIEERSKFIGNWNNLYAPHIGIDVAAEIPFARIAYFNVIEDSLQDDYDPPVVVLDETGTPMKNNIVRGDYFNVEARIPNIRIFGSNRAKFYVAWMFKEFHFGMVARELKIGKVFMDWRINAMLPGKRDYQILFECYFNNFGAGFSNNAFGIGPSIRIGKTPTENLGVITAFLNARFKVGDFFDKSMY